MHPADVREHLRRLPFRPLRLYISDGATHEVWHPELVLVSRTDVATALDPGDGDMPERMVYSDPLHIARIEPIPRKTGRARRRRG